MTPITYFKLQAKNLLKDYKTKEPVFDETINDYLYEYSPTYFDVDRIILEHNLDEKFTLMKSQHVMANMVGFRKWADLLKASGTELELAKLLFDNQNKIHIEDWEMYVAGVENDNNITLSPDDRLEIFKKVFFEVDGHVSPFGDYRLNKKIAA